MESWINIHMNETFTVRRMVDVNVRSYMSFMSEAVLFDTLDSHMHGFLT